MARRRTDLDVLVAGARGKQGGAVARALLDRGHRVRALTRRPDSERAHRLEELGAEVVRGDLERPAGLVRAVDGADAAFAVATPFEEGPRAETRQATNLVEAAGQAGVEHLVYSSAAAADQGTGIPHFESKVSVEHRVRQFPGRWTIVAPTFFADNLLLPGFVPFLSQGKLALSLPEDTPLQVVSAADLGAAVARVLERSGDLDGRRIELAADEVTPARMAEVVSQASGRGIQPAEIPLESLRESSPALAAMFAWLQDVGFSVDLDRVRETFPALELDDFATWANGVDWDAHLQG